MSFEENHKYLHSGVTSSVMSFVLFDHNQLEDLIGKEA